MLSSSRLLISCLMLLWGSLGLLRWISLVLLLGISTWSPPKSLACLKGFLLGSGLIWSRRGLSLLVCLLLLLVSVLGMILGGIVGILWLVVLLWQLRFVLVLFSGIGGLFLIWLFVPLLLIPVGLVWFLSLLSVLRFGPLLGCLPLISLGVLSLLRFRGFGIFMMRGFSSCLGEDALGLDSALLCGDVSSAWMIWSSAAESALADAFRFAGGPVPTRGLVLGRGMVRIRTVRLGGPIVRSVRRSAVRDGDVDDVSLYRDSSAAPVLDLRRNLRAILDLLDSIIRWGASLARDVQLLHLWDSVVRLGSLGSVHVWEYEAARVCGVCESRRIVAELHGRVSAFVRGLVAYRRNVGITAWRNWLREDPLVHPYKWLRADLVPPSPFLQCSRALTPGGSGVLADPARIDEEFRKAWLPYFCRSGQRETSLDEFNHECSGWLPCLNEFSLPTLTGDMLFEVVKRKGSTAGSLDGWGWRELKVLPVAWFDGLAKILTRVEETGVWPDGLLDAYITMIPKVDGDATPLGQRPLTVLPVVYRVWASARMIQLEPWFRSWVPSCVFSAGGGRSSVQAWFTTALDIEEVLSGIVEGDVHIFVADVIKSFDTVDRGILDRVLSSLGLPGWFRHSYFEFHSLVRLRFKLAAGLGQPWTRDGGIPQGCPLSMMFIVALYLPWCRYLAAQGEFSLSSMLII